MVGKASRGSVSDPRAEYVCGMSWCDMELMAGYAEASWDGGQGEFIQWSATSLVNVILPSQGPFQENAPTSICQLG